MITIWEATQGVWFLSVLGLITRGVTWGQLRQTVRKPPMPSRAPVSLPRPRQSAEDRETQVV